MNEVILYFSKKYAGDWQKIFDALKNKEVISRDDLEEMKETSKEMNYITLLDDLYPESFKMMKKPPFVIYYKGNIDLLYKRSKLWVLSSKKVDSKRIGEVAKMTTLIMGMSDELERNCLSKTALFNLKNGIIVKDYGINLSKLTNNELDIVVRNNLILSLYPDNRISSLDTWIETSDVKEALSTGILFLTTSKDRTILNLTKEFKSNLKDILLLSSKDSKSYNSELAKLGSQIINSVEELNRWT